MLAFFVVGCLMATGCPLYHLVPLGHRSTSIDCESHTLHVHVMYMTCTLMYMYVDICRITGSIVLMVVHSMDQCHCSICKSLILYCCIMLLVIIVMCLVVTSLTVRLRGLKMVCFRTLSIFRKCVLVLLDLVNMT